MQLKNNFREKAVWVFPHQTLSHFFFHWDTGTDGVYKVSNFMDAYETCVVTIPGTITLGSVFKAVRSFHILGVPELSSCPGCHASPCWLASADCIV